MPEHKIKISYSTGDSFSSYDTSEFLELTWKSLDVAKENLQRIKEHYEMYRELNKYNPKLIRDQIFEQNKDREWFVNTPKLYCISSGNAIEEKHKKKVGEGNWGYRPDDYQATYCLYLIADNGNKMQLSAFWCGHFELLRDAEIIVDDSDLKISF